MSSLRWLEAGATGSYGTVTEPCNFPGKFPHPGLVMKWYFRGDTLIEAYWKSVAMPGEGLFIGEPLAAPYAGHRLYRQGGTLVLETRVLRPDGSVFEVREGPGAPALEVEWKLLGVHNVANAGLAVATARATGVPVETACRALATFPGVRRRLELVGCAGGVRVYDDFAHHPSAIAAGLAALRASVPSPASTPGTNPPPREGRKGGGRVLAALEPRSNSMRMGTHGDALARALADADLIFALEPPGLDWDLATALVGPGRNTSRARVAQTVDALLDALLAQARDGDRIVCMSNGAFGGLPHRLLEGLRAAREGGR